jgi:hypothetical protein
MSSEILASVLQLAYQKICHAYHTRHLCRVSRQKTYDLKLGNDKCYSTVYYPL